MGVMNVAQKIHIVPVTSTISITADLVLPHINMKEYERVEFILHLGALATANFVLFVTQSAVTAGTTATAIAARYRLSGLGGVDAMGDVTALSSSGLTLTDGTYDLLTLVIDVDSQDMTTDSKPYVGLFFDDPGTATAVVTCMALCWPKFPKETNANALT